jgi:hypothetical protein
MEKTTSFLSLCGITRVCHEETELEDRKIFEPALGNT